MSKIIAQTLALLLLNSALFARAAAQIKPILPKANTRAVLVGISSYESVPSLRFADKDAQAFAQYLHSPAGGNVPEGNIKLLTNEAATQAQIGKALSWLITESQENDQAIIYFSGHGDVESQISNLGYLLAYDANKTTYMAGGAIPVYAIQSVVTNLSAGKQVQVILIADACRSGKLAGSETGGSKTTALAMAAQFANEVKLMSCSPDELSLEGEEWDGGHSVFSYYLLNGLRGLADIDENREITLREIERFLEDSVRHATAAIRRQTPMVFGSKDRVIAKVDRKTLDALQAKKNPPKTETGSAGASKSPAADSDTSVMRLYREFEEAMRTGHLLVPEAGAAYTIFQQIKDHPLMRPYRNLMSTDLAAALQSEAQKAIKDYLSADPREMRRRWALDDSRYNLYPLYLEKSAELFGEGHFSYKQLKALEYYFSGLNLRLQGERSKNAAQKDSLFAAAKQLQQKTLQIDSTAAYAYNELGLLARRSSQFAQSVDYFNKALQFSPTWALPWANLCGSYTELGQLEEAEKCGLRTLELDNSSALAHYNLGYVFNNKSLPDKAAFHFQKTIEYSPEYADAYFNLGLYHYHRAEYAKAEQMMKGYQARMPNDPDGHQNLGEIALKLSRPQEAEGHFLKAISLDAQYKGAYFSLGEIYLANNESAKAEKRFKEFVALDPENAEGYYQLAKVKSQDPLQALQYLETAFQKGFKDLERLQAEPLLAALRARSDYKKLLKKYAPGK